MHTPRPLTLVMSSLIAMTATSAHAQSAPRLMDAQWTAAACAQWNATRSLTEGLAGDWVRNDGGKGFKLIHLYRTDCGEATQTELRIVAEGEQARCAYGGAVQHSQMDSAVDYTMHAKSAHWGEMGRGQYGPMRAMMFGALKFSGPKMEAMGVMGPFEAFLLLVGQVPGNAAACPGQP